MTLNDTIVGSRPKSPTVNQQQQIPSSSHSSSSSSHPSSSSSQTNNPSTSKFIRFITMFGALELTNKGAVARDHLANERTYLAWLRTSLAFASIGVAITQFFRLQSSTTTRNLIEATREFGNIAITSNLDASTTTSSDSEYVLTESPPLLVQTPEFYHYVENIYIQDRRLTRLSTMLGSLFIWLAVLTMLIGVFRFFYTQHYLQKGVFPVSRISIVALFTLTAALIITNFVVIIKTNL